jgi:hypothetical protein
MNGEEMSEQLLFFDSDFESGNLDMVALTCANSADEYDLMMRLDTNSRTHQNWFYYSVRIRHDIQDKKKRTVKFNLLNFTKEHSLFGQTMQPVIWS